MKIGLLTVPFNNNYGGLLQAYALKTILTDMGHEVHIINRRRNPSNSLKFRLYHLLVRLHVIQDYLSDKTKSISVNTEMFKRKYLEPITEPYYSSKDLLRCLELRIDAFVVGSDQVWRYRYARESIDDYFFSFLKGSRIPRFSYAASFGTEEMDYPDDKRVIATELLKEFSAISVREESGRDILVNWLGVDPMKAKVVLDPTLLLSPDKYVNLFKGQRFCDDNYLFTYVLDASLCDYTAINSFVVSSGLKQMNLKAQTGDIRKLEIIEPIEKWLSGIYYSQCVITDSFHGTVFSIIFNKPFIVVANPIRGLTRIKSLLSKFGLEDHLVVDLGVSYRDVLNRRVDWFIVNQKLQEWKELSIQYLIDAINSISN